MKIDSIIEVKSELGAGTRGASLGIDAVKLESAEVGKTFFAKLPSLNIPTENQLLFEPVETPYARWIRGIHQVAERTCNQVAKNFKNHSAPLVLTGDHGNAAGVIAGMKKAFPDKEIGIVWIDAHADLHTPYTSPSGNMHGMPLAAALGMDNDEQKTHDPSEATVKLWEQMKNLGDIQPKIKPENLAFLGLRDFEAQEKYLLQHLDITHYGTAEMRKIGIDHVCRQVLSQLENCDHIYLSFDVDSLDPSISRGTGTPVKDGFEEREAVQIINELAASDKVKLLEITEVNPLLDTENKMAKTVVRMLDEILD